MSEQMAPFHPDVTCPKCGSEDLRVEWCAPVPARNNRSAKPERMNILCDRCKYGWQMAPMTAKEAQR